METQKSPDDTSPTSQDQRDHEYMDYSTDATLRHRFIRKTFFLLGLTLTITFGLVCIFRFVEPAKTFIIKANYLFILAFVAVFCITIVFGCFPSVGRIFPWNLILLFVFACLYGLLLGYATIAYSADSILYAAGLTLLLTVVLILFACQTRFDFTGWGPYLLVASFGLLIFAIFAIIFQSRILHLVYALIGTIITCFYIIFDTQLIIGGNKYQLSEADYVFGCFVLYIDIVSLFLYLLRLTGSRG